MVRPLKSQTQSVRSFKFLIGFAKTSNSVGVPAKILCAIADPRCDTFTFCVGPLKAEMLAAVAEIFGASVEIPSVTAEIFSAAAEMPGAVTGIFSVAAKMSGAMPLKFQTQSVR